MAYKSPVYRIIAVPVKKIEPSNIIKELHELGRSDAWIAKHLGMDRDEILRLKQITGLTALLKDVDFSAAWQPVEDVQEQDYEEA